MYRLLLLMALCLLLTGCTAQDPLATLAVPAPAAEVPSPEAPAASTSQNSVTLWFRFGDEPLLAPEIRTLDFSPTASRELTLLQALVSGPTPGSAELTALFPPGTRVISTHQQGRILFVTLSRQIMNNWADEPDNWARLEAWADEVPLRRRLAMQSIAATVTENCDVDQVVILVEQGAQITDSLRLRQSYYRTDSDSQTLAAPLTRDAALLLTPDNTMDVILACWQERNWQRLYPFIARTDAATGLERPAYADFAAEMEQLPHLTGSVFSGGSISPDGLQAVYTVDASLLSGGRESAASGRLLRLTRERGVWRVGLSQLTAWKGVAP